MLIEQIKKIYAHIKDVHVSILHFTSNEWSTCISVSRKWTDYL